MNIQKYTIIYEEEALQALADIGLYYEWQGGDDLKRQIIKRIQTHIQTLDFMPERNQLSDFSDKVRRLVIYKLPYIAFYTIQGDNVHILEVLHAKKDQEFLHEKYQDFQGIH